MQIPPDATFSDEKLTRYLLVFRPKDDKSKFLAQAGFTLENATKLKDSIIRLAIAAEAIEDGNNRLLAEVR